jgi:glucosylglycerate phosphorylase
MGSPEMPGPGSFHELLFDVYGDPLGGETASRLENLLAERAPRISPQAVTDPISERDVLLITYPDQVQQAGQPPLQTLHSFLERHGASLITAVHLLPFFPSSSDDGFSVTDYLAVEPAYGTWQDVTRYAGRYRLMVDAVLNHTSARSPWFQGFSRGEAPWRDYFVTPDPQADWSHVIRPRATPLFTAFDSGRGPLPVWTTFSADQVDLNYANPDVLLEMVTVLLEYLRRGAQWIRLDAVGYLWKEAGSTCLHLPQTHRIVRLLRAILDRLAPWARLITETNVPHIDNVAYFGAGDEAHMVYQFSLAPLVVHALLAGDAGALTDWATGLTKPPPGACYLNFLASHDGIGLTPTRGILADAAIEFLADRARACGGGVSYRTTQAGGLQPYELNVNLLDVLSGPEQDGQPSIGIRRFLLAHAILLSMAGIPAIYFHSLFGSRGDPEAVQRTGHLRSINRQKVPAAGLESEMAAPSSSRRMIFDGLKRLIQARRSLPPLHPMADQEVLDLGPQLFAVRRVAASGQEVVCVAEVSARPARVRIPSQAVRGVDLLANEYLGFEAVDLAPLQVRWILAQPEAG